MYIGKDMVNRPGHIMLIYTNCMKSGTWCIPHQQNQPDETSNNFGGIGVRMLRLMQTFYIG